LAIRHDIDQALITAAVSRLWIRATTGQSALAGNFFPRAAEPLAGEDVFRGFTPRKTDGGKQKDVKSPRLGRNAGLSLTA
jgi:hypothetical protein